MRLCARVGWVHASVDLLSDLEVEVGVHLLLELRVESFAAQVVPRAPPQLGESLHLLPSLELVRLQDSGDRRHPSVEVVALGPEPLAARRRKRVEARAPIRLRNAPL